MLGIGRAELNISWAAVILLFCWRGGREGSSSMWEIDMGVSEDEGTQHVKCSQEI